MNSEPTEEVQIVSEVAEVPECSGITEVQEISEQTKEVHEVLDTPKDRAVRRSQNLEGLFKEKVLQLFPPPPRSEGTITPRTTPTTSPVATALKVVHQNSEEVEDVLFIDNGKEVHEVPEEEEMPDIQDKEVQAVTKKLQSAFRSKISPKPKVEEFPDDRPVGRSENQEGRFKKKVLNRILFRPKPEELIVPPAPPAPTALEEVHENSEIVENVFSIDNGKEVHEASEIVEKVLFIDNGKEVDEVSERVKEIKSVFIDNSKKVTEGVHKVSEIKEEIQEVSEIKEKVHHEVSFNTEDQEKVKDESSETDISTSPNDSPAPSHFSLSTLGLKNNAYPRRSRIISELTP